MKINKRLILSFCLALSICLISSCGGGNDEEPLQIQAETAQLTDLFLAFSTRTDVTTPNIQEAMIPVAEAAGVSFRDSLQDKPMRAQFISDLGLALEAYTQEYEAAPVGVDGVEDRVSAIHHLLNNFMFATENARITHDELILALLSAFTTIEQMLAAEPTSLSLNPEDRELIDLLLLSILNQVELRNYPKVIIAQFEVLGTDTTFTDLINQSQSALNYEVVLIAALKRVEEPLSDPVVVADKDALLSHQFNQLSTRDVARFNIAMDLDLLPQSIDLTSLISRMNSVGGIMAELTGEQLFQSGVIQLLQYVIYDWVRPEMSLSYQPIPGLSDELAQLGGTVPAIPDFSIFADPYLAIVQLKYDLNIYIQIAVEEWEQVGTEVFNLTGQPHSMTQRYSCKLTHETYKQNVMNQFSGASEKEEQAILSLLSFFWIYY